MDLAETIVFGIGFLVVAVAGALYTTHASPIVRLLAAGVGIGMMISGVLVVLFMTLIGVM